MAADHPNCPKCVGPISPDWDWCHHCGYDPEGLKPADWFPGPPPGSQGGSVATKSRRTRTAKAPKATRAPKPAKVKAKAAAAPGPAMPAPPPLFDPMAAGSPRPASAPIPTSAPDRSATGVITYALKPSQLELGIVGALGLVALFMVLIAGASLLSLVGHGTLLNKVTAVIFALVCLAIAGGFGAQAYVLLKVRVELGPDELAVFNRIGRPQHIGVAEIFSVKLTTRQYDIGFGMSRTGQVPYVQGADGSGFWIDALGGRNGDDPNPGQMAVFERLAAAVKVHRPVPPALSVDE